MKHLVFLAFAGGLAIGLQWNMSKHRSEMRDSRKTIREAASAVVDAQKAIDECKRMLFGEEEPAYFASCEAGQFLNCDGIVCTCSEAM